VDGQVVDVRLTGQGPPVPAHTGSLPSLHTISTHSVRNLHKGAFKLTKSEREMNTKCLADDEISSELLAAKQK